MYICVCVCVYTCIILYIYNIYMYTGLEIGGVASQNVNHF